VSSQVSKVMPVLHQTVPTAGGHQS